MFTINAYAVDNNCQVNVIHILQVPNALRCIEGRLDTLENNPTSGEANTASNLGSGNVSGVFSQKVGIDLQFKSLKGSPDILVHNDGTNTITIDYNGSASGEANTASCDAYLNGECLFAQKSGVDLQFKKILSPNSKLTVTSNSSNIILTNTLTGESTICTNLGSVGEGIYVSGNCDFKKLLAGTGISLSSNGTRITITNTGVINNNCTKGITCSGTNPSQFDTNFSNGTGISITGTTTQTFTNTGVISNSCTAPIVCSGTNPSAISFSDSPYWQMLCQTSLGSNNATISCSFTAKKHLLIISEIKMAGGTVEPAYRFNNDAGTNYAFRLSINGAADITGTNLARCNLQTSAVTFPQDDGVFATMFVYNNVLTERKLTVGQVVHGIETSDTTSPTKNEIACKWDNGTAQINKITWIVQSGTGNYKSGSVVTVWGYD